MNGAKAAAATCAMPRSPATSSVGWPGAGLVPDLVVAEQHAERLAAGRAELLLVDLAGTAGSGRTRAPARGRGRLRPADVQQADLGGRCRRRRRPDRRRRARTPPAAGAWVVQDGVDLRRDQGVDPGDLPVDRRQQRPAVAQQARGLRPSEPEDERLRPAGLGQERDDGTGPVGVRPGRPPAKMRSIRSGPRPVRSSPDGRVRRRRPRSGIGRRLSRCRRRSGCAPPCAARWSAPPTAARAAARRPRCRSRACPGSP